MQTDIPAKLEVQMDGWWKKNAPPNLVEFGESVRGTQERVNNFTEEEHVDYLAAKLTNHLQERGDHRVGPVLPLYCVN